MKAPPMEEWGFPQWIVCVCGNSENFGAAKDLLRKKYGFVDSPFETERFMRALVLPRPDASLEEVIERAKRDDDNYKGWGIGRVRFCPNSRNSRGGPYYDFKYFPGTCPWDYIRSNPMKEPLVELFHFLNPSRFMNQNGIEITFPYPV